jgi:ABC-type Mn2+/Zn2+ transport system permease subunit
VTWEGCIATSLLCIALGLAAKYVIDVPILQWIMLIAAIVYFILAVIKGAREP